jgi:type I site-specific restriction-modification system R (restriction) subunit
MTEREERKEEVLKTLDDFLNLYIHVDDAASEVTNSKQFDKGLNRIGKGIDKKINYIMSISKQYTRRQGFIARLRDRLIEKKRRSIEQDEQEREDERRVLQEAQDFSSEMLSLEVKENQKKLIQGEVIQDEEESEAQSSSQKDEDDANFWKK